ncbi:MAG: hypothetical protein ACFFFH_00080 [Candidatus Thorarchaeota archaeon]
MGRSTISLVSRLEYFSMLLISSTHVPVVKIIPVTSTVEVFLDFYNIRAFEL